MNLFQHQGRDELKRRAPLAARMRPRSFDELVGQEHIIGPECVLRKSIESDQMPSIVLWGPPGTGKTTLANIISTTTKSHFSPVSGVGSGVADLRLAASDAQERLGMHGQGTILFVDEIHRFNKSQQDVILPYVENGTLVLIGATTENPSFEVISPLLSRCRVFTLKSLTDRHIENIVHRSILDHERGLASLSPQLESDAANMLITLSNGDARVALNALELATLSVSPNDSGVRLITTFTIKDAMQRRSLPYDRAGDNHYDTISAFIKSVRGSDPDAAIYWLARMVEAGEDPLFISRRLIILAAEDIGMADPQALPIAVAAQQAVHFIGMPEGRIPLAEATVYLATAPKSNTAYAAINQAIEDIQKTPAEPVPLHLRNPSTDLSREIGYGKQYKYPHSYEGHFTPTQNLPDNLRGRQYYKPSEQGYEREVHERLSQWWELGEKYPDSINKDEQIND